MSLFDVLLADFFGNSVLLGLTVIAVIISLAFFIRSSKYVIEGISIIAVYALLKASYIQPWVFFIVLVIVGLDIGKLLIGAITGR